MKILLTSVCRPLGPRHGDGPSVGYELLFGQVTRAQGIFSPRALHLHFSLEYIADNLESPAVVLQYPSKQELIRELKKGYDYVGVSFLLALFHKMKDVVALIREYAPQSKIVLGGYGTVLNDEVLKPYGDFICREEGVAFFRKLLGEPAIPMPYKHPLIVSRLKVFSVPVSSTGMIFAGLGCPNGCDFCCTSYFFRRRHIRLLPEGKDIYAVIERYLDIDPSMVFVILDEDFLLNKRRAMEFRACVLKGGKPLRVFVFSSVRAISQYTMEEIMEMGIDAFWIGYEGTRSGYAKQQGRPVDELFRDLREHGITILASMIVGFDYQTQEVVAKELDGLMSLRPTLAQFLIYGPTPGTPFYERIMREGLLHDALRENPEQYYRKCDGFTTMVKHPTLSPSEIEDMQRWCFREDFRRLGPSIFRALETSFLGWKKMRDSTNPLLRRRAEGFAKAVRAGYPALLAGKLFGPSPAARQWLQGFERQIHAELGRPTWKERFLSVVTLGAALWTWVTLRIDFFQHPRLIRTAYRMPARRWQFFHLWEDLPENISIPGLSIRVELQHAREQVWLRLEGFLSAAQTDGLGQRIKDALAKTRGRLVLDLKNLTWKEAEAMRGLARKLKDYRSRIRLVPPQASAVHPEFLLLARVFQLYGD